MKGVVHYTFLNHFWIKIYDAMLRVYYTFKNEWNVFDIKTAVLKLQLINFLVMTEKKSKVRR